jgi:hypothetical protein
LYEDRDELMTSTRDGFDTQLWIYDRFGREIAYVDDIGFAHSPGSSKFARWEGSLPPGQYYARVKAANVFSTIEEYTVAFFVYPETIFAPYIPSEAVLTPEVPRSHEDLEVDARGGYAADGSQDFAYWYVWYRNGEIVPFGETKVETWEEFNLEHLHAVGPGRLPAGFTQASVLPSQYTAEGETWHAKVYTKDDNGFSLDGLETNEVTIGGDSWSLGLRIHKSYTSDQSDVHDSVTIGWFPDATHGFDKDLDAKLPSEATTVPPFLDIDGNGTSETPSWEELVGATYSAGLESDALRLKRDWRLYGVGTAWYLIVEFGQNPESIVIEWDNPATVAAGDLPLMISEVDGWDGIDDLRYRLTLNMRTNNRIVIPASELRSGGYKVYRISLGAAEDGQSIHLDYGWNLISFAVTPVMPSVSDVFDVSGETVIAGPVWTFKNNSYTKADTVEANRGYWLYCDVPGGATIRAMGVRGYEMIPLDAGWNTVGPTETVDAPNGGEDIYGYDNARDEHFEVSSGGFSLPAWHQKGKLVKGRGYWIYSETEAAVEAE